MTPAEIAAWGAVIVLIIGAIASGVVTVLTALGRIEGKVDGAASVSVAKISALQNEVVTLHSVIADRKEIAAVLAANQSSVDQVIATKVSEIKK